jgi:hypothetical protein
VPTLATGTLGVAVGGVAIGGLAVGGVAVGGVAIAGVAFGAGSVGDTGTSVASKALAAPPEVTVAPGEPSEPLLGPDTPTGTTVVEDNGWLIVTSTGVELTDDGYVLRQATIYVSPDGAVTLVERVERVWVEDGVQYWAWEEKEYTYWNTVAFAVDQPQSFRYRGENNHQAEGKDVDSWDDTGIVPWGYERGDLVRPDGDGYVELTDDAPHPTDAWERGQQVFIVVAADEGWLAPDAPAMATNLLGSPRPARRPGAPRTTTGVETESLSGRRSGQIEIFQAEVEAGHSIWVVEDGVASRRIVPPGTPCETTADVWCP